MPRHPGGGTLPRRSRERCDDQELTEATEHMPARRSASELGKQVQDGYGRCDRSLCAAGGSGGVLIAYAAARSARRGCPRAGWTRVDRAWSRCRFACARRASQPAARPGRLGRGCRSSRSRLTGRVAVAGSWSVRCPVMPARRAVSRRQLRSRRRARLLAARPPRPARMRRVARQPLRSPGARTRLCALSARRRQRRAGRRPRSAVGRRRRRVWRPGEYQGPAFMA
jgi:hypothetical protein